MAICSCVNCRRWRNSKATSVRGTKRKEQWEARKRMYMCINVEKHTMEHYMVPDNEPLGSVILGSICQDGVSSPTSVSHETCSAKRRAAESIHLESQVGKPEFEVEADDDISDMNFDDGCIIVGVPPPPDLL
jgi:hypothetical protein